MTVCSTQYTVHRHLNCLQVQRTCNETTKETSEQRTVTKLQIRDEEPMLGRWSSRNCEKWTACKASAFLFGNAMLQNPKSRLDDKDCRPCTLPHLTASSITATNGRICPREPVIAGNHTVEDWNDREAHTHAPLLARLWLHWWQE